MRLLREDEAFRYAVMGLLGITDVQAGIKQLIDALGKVLEVVKQLADGQGQILEVVKGLAEGQARLIDGQAKLMDAVRQLAENQARLMEGQAKLMDVAGELAENQRELMSMTRQVLEVVQRLADVEARHMEVTQRMLEELKALKDGQEALRAGLNNLSRRVDGLSRSYGGLSKSMGLLIERDVRRYLPAWVRNALSIGIDKLRRRVIEGVGEFDCYAEANNKVVVAEVKATLRLRDVEDFVDKVKKLRQTMAGKEIIAIIAYVFKGRDFSKAIELAKANNIRVVRHIGEEDFEED